MVAKTKKVEAKNDTGFHPILSYCVILPHFVPLLVAKVEAKKACEIYERISEHFLTRLDAYSPNG